MKAFDKLQKFSISSDKQFHGIKFTGSWIQSRIKVVSLLPSVDVSVPTILATCKQQIESRSGLCESSSYILIQAFIYSPVSYLKRKSEQAQNLPLLKWFHLCIFIPISCARKIQTVWRAERPTHNKTTSKKTPHQCVFKTRGFEN